MAVVVLNWNRPRDTVECLRSLKRSTVPLYVIVVDNGSSDDSIAVIESSGLADEIIDAADNLGFAEGNNVGIRQALADGFSFIAVLNNDTVVESTTIALLLERLPAGQLRAVSPDIRYEASPEKSWFAGGIIDRGLPRHLQADELLDFGPMRPTECLTGCCIVARRETWEQVGLFDHSFFLIFEDSDWSLRARRLGAELYVVTASLLIHRVSVSFTRGAPTFLSSYYFIRNGFLFEARYYFRRVPAFAYRWLLRPAPRLVLDRRLAELVFRWLGAVAFALNARGRAYRWVESLASALASGDPDVVPSSPMVH